MRKAVDSRRKLSPSPPHLRKTHRAALRMIRPRLAQVPRGRATLTDRHYILSLVVLSGQTKYFSLRRPVLAAAMVRTVYRLWAVVAPAPKHTPLHRLEVWSVSVVVRTVPAVVLRRPWRGK